MVYDNIYSPTHEISPLTLAVVAKKDETGTVHAIVLEDEMEYKVEHSPSKLIDYACQFFGASLKGRQDGTKSICGITHKVPIAIDPSSGMYFFPTTSPTSTKCNWIAHSHINHVRRVDSKTSEIVFKNGKKVVLDTSYGSIMNQIHRTAQYRYLLDKRINHLQQRDPDPGKEPET